MEFRSDAADRGAARGCEGSGVLLGFRSSRGFRSFASDEGSGVRE